MLTLILNYLGILGPPCYSPTGRCDEYHDCCSRCGWVRPGNGCECVCHGFGEGQGDG